MLRLRSSFSLEDEIITLIAGDYNLELAPDRIADLVVKIVEHVASVQQAIKENEPKPARTSGSGLGALIIASMMANTNSAFDRASQERKDDLFAEIFNRPGSPFAKSDGPPEDSDPSVNDPKDSPTPSGEGPSPKDY